MHQLTLFAQTEPAKVLKFPTPATHPKSQETGLEAIYPQPNYGTCLKCESSIIWPGLDTCKCSGCGYVATKFVTFSLEYPKVKPVEMVPVEPAPMTTTCESMPDTEPLKAWAKSIEETHATLTQIFKEESPIVTKATGKILSFSITTERAAAMGVPDPLIAGIKVCTRRAKWTAPTIAYYQRAYEEGLLIQAYSAMPFVTCKNPRKMADIRLTRRPYLEALGDMPEEDLIAEGGLWKTREEFIHTVCNGKPDPSLRVWVNWFEVVNICV